jgi:DNA-binding NtrC family response regulator
MSKETIMVLDTDKNITWTLKTLLESENYPVVITDSAEKASRNFTEFQVSGFITEYWVKNASTLDSIRKLKEMYPESYVMVITDRELREEEYEELIGIGVDDFFLKPVPIKRVLLHLKKGLRNRRILIGKNRFDKEGIDSNPAEGTRFVPKMEVIPV